MDSKQKITPLDTILNCIESNKNFVLQGGAGSGKTETLKQLLSQLNIKYPNKKIACITHTNLAVEEIKSRVGEGYVIDTIHSFLYSIIKDYKKNMHSVISEIFKIEMIERADVSFYVDEKEQKVKEHAKYKKVYEKYASRLYNVNKNTMPKAEGKRDYDLEPEKYNGLLNEHIEALNQEIEQIIAEKDYNGIKYNDSRFDNFKKISFGHNSLLKIATLLFESFPLLSKIVRDKFDYILIDEYQDTHKDVVKIFVNNVSEDGKTTIGFFGDSMQGIYDDGVGDVESYISSGQLTKINKEDNYRCSEDVITFINQIRNDGLEQKLAFKTKNGLAETGAERQGEVKLYYSIYSEERTPGGTPKDKALYSQKLNSLITIVQEKHPNFKKLVLTNKSISGELGFNNLYEIFNARYSEVKEEIEKDLTRLQLIDLVELCDAFVNKRYNEVLVKIKYAGYELKKLEDKTRVSTILNEIIDSEKSAIEVLDLAYSNNLLGKSDSYEGYVAHKDEFLNALKEDEDYQVFKTNYTDDGHTYSKITKKGLVIEEEDFKEKERDYKRECFYIDLFSDKISFKEIVNYYNYLEEKSEYITMHKTKGTGIENVMVVLDEYFWTKYNFKTIFDNSETDIEKRLHNQKLFYVAASRTINTLICIKLISADEESNLKEYFNDTEEINLV